MSQMHLLREKKYLWAPFWGLLFFAFIIAVSSFFAFVRTNQQVNHYDLNGDLVREFAEAKKHTDLSVVILGNSRMRNATSMGYDPDKVYTLPDGRTVTVLQFAQNMGRFANYQDLVVPILRAHPDVIIMQDGMIANYLDQSYDVPHFAKTMVGYYEQVLKGNSVPQEWFHNRHTPIPCQPRKYDSDEMDQYLAFMDDFRHIMGKDNPGFMAAQSFIDNALRLGIKVVMLRMMPQADFFDRMDVPTYESNFHGLGRWPSHAELVPAHYNDVTWLSYEETDLDNFCDWIHLNEKGSVIFENWFLHEIQSVKPQ